MCATVYSARLALALTHILLQSSSLATFDLHLQRKLIRLESIGQEDHIRLDLLPTPERHTPFIDPNRLIVRQFHILPIERGDISRIKDAAFACHFELAWCGEQERVVLRWGTFGDVVARDGGETRARAFAVVFDCLEEGRLEDENQDPALWRRASVRRRGGSDAVESVRASTVRT